jgi:hypothetical protein
LICGNIPELLERVEQPSPILHVLRPLITESEIEEKFLIPVSIASSLLSPLDREALEELAKDILGIKTADELAAWINAHKSNGPG